jgi:hypothetical protein
MNRSNSMIRGGCTTRHGVLLCGVLLCAIATAGRAGPAAPPPYADAVAGIEKTPAAALELVRNRIAFRPYSGFVKGPQAAWRDGTANANDAAELLRDVLRQKKIPARLAFGTLAAERVDALLGSLPASKPPAKVQKSMTGTPSPGPVRDAALRKSVARHVWVQARSGGKWVDLDAVVPGLAVGEAPAPVEKTLAAPPRADRRRLRIEILGKSAAAKAKPTVYLRHEAPVADLAGGPLALAHQPVKGKTADPKGGPKGLRPVLLVPGRVVRGRPYGGAPAGSAGAGRLGDVFGHVGGAPALPAEISARFTLTGGGKPDRTALRHITLGGPDGLNRLGDLTVFTIAFGAPPAELVTQRLAGNPTLAELAKTVKLPDGPPSTPEETKQAALLFSRTIGVAEGLGMWLARATHRTLSLADQACGTVSDYDDPRLLSIAISPRENRISTDLVFDQAATWPLAGTKSGAPEFLRTLRGRLDSELEAALISAIAPEGGPGKRAILSADAILHAALEQNIPPALLTREKKDCLKAVDCPDWVRTILSERLADGRVIFIPSRPVAMPGWKKPVTAWYEVDRTTGAWTGVLQDGRHSSMAEMKMLRDSVAMLAGLNSTYILSYMGTLTIYTYTRIGLTGNPGISEEQIHQQAIEAASSFDWFSAYLELVSASMASSTWNPQVTAATTAQGVVMLFGGQHNALEFINSQYSPQDDPQNP